MLKLKVKSKRTVIMPIAGLRPQCCERISALVNDINDALQTVGSTEYTILSGNFNARTGTDSESWKGVLNRYEDPAFNENSQYLLLLCCNNRLCILNTFLQHKDSTSTHGTDLDGAEVFDKLLHCFVRFVFGSIRCASETRGRIVN